MKTLLAFAFALIAVFAATLHHANAQEPAPMDKPKVIFFDVNETLLDLQGMQSSVSEALGGREDLMQLWFSTMLHHSLVDTVTERYHDFGTIGVNALLMVAETHDIELTEEAARDAIATPLQNLPAHPDVVAGLKALKAQGYTLISFTNSSNKGVQTQFENAGLTELFDQRLSIEDIKIYKPDLRAYEWALDKAGVEPGEAMMVAAHGWDIAGAKAAGMKATFVSRPGKALYPLAIEPDHVVSDIGALAQLLEAED